MKYVGVEEVQALTGLSKRTMYRRLSELPRVKDPQDRRRRLVPVADVLKLREPPVVAPTAKKAKDGLAP